MAKNAAVRSSSGSGNWIGHTDIWNDPRAQLASEPTPEPTKPEPTPQNAPTQKQLDYLKALFESRKHIPEIPFLRAHLLQEFKQGTFTRKMASEAIQDILAIRP